MNTIIRNSTKTEIGARIADEIIEDSKIVSQCLMAVVDSLAKDHGIIVSKLNFVNISYPQDILDLLAARKKAEIEGKTELIKAEAFKKALITKAEGRAEALRIENAAENEVHDMMLEREQNTIRAIKKVFPGKPEEYMKYLIAMKYLDTIQAISKEGGNIAVKLADGVTTTELEDKMETHSC